MIRCCCSRYCQAILQVFPGAEGRVTIKMIGQDVTFHLAWSDVPRLINDLLEASGRLEKPVKVIK